MPTTTATLLRTARLAGRLSQAALAARVGARQPNIATVEGARRDLRAGQLRRWVAGTGHRLALLPTSATPACEAALAVRGRLAAGDEEAAFREVLQLSDDLAAAPSDVRVALVVTRPPATGDRRFDALVAAVVDHHLERDGLPRPAWLDEDGRALDARWYVDDVPGARRIADADAVSAGLRRNVIIAARELASA